MLINTLYQYAIQEYQCYPPILFMYISCLLNRELYVLSILYIPNGDTFWLSPYLFMCQSFDFYVTQTRLRLWLCPSSAQHQQKEVMFPLSTIFRIIRLLRSTKWKNKLITISRFGIFNVRFIISINMSYSLH